MKDEKRLSVIIPGYNTSEECWRRCVASVRYACGDHDEIICVDDGSKVSVKEDWVGTDVDCRVKLITKKNGGLSSARNAGLVCATGRYVAFVDSDDDVCRDVYNRTIAMMDKTSSDIGIFGVETIWVAEGLVKRDLADNRSYGELTADDLFDLRRRCLLNYAWNKVYSRRFLLHGNSSVGFHFDENGMPYEDIMFNLECVMAGAKWCSVDYCGYHYYRQGLTLLSRFKSSIQDGYNNCANVWEKWRRWETLKCGRKISPTVAEWVDRQPRKSIGALNSIIWRNIWMPGSPYSLLWRWQWLRGTMKHSFWRCVCKYLRMAVFTVLRRNVYIRPIRRWNILRKYPYAVESQAPC